MSDENENLETKPRKIYIAHNKILAEYFDDKDDAETFAYERGTADSLRVSEAFVHPKGCFETEGK